MITASRFIQDAVPPSRREYIAADADDPTAYDANGILRDGYKIRIPLTMMDASPVQRVATVPRNITTGLTGKYKLDSFFYPDGSAKPARKIWLRDIGEVEESTWVDDAATASHRPGFRGVDAARGVVADGQQLKDAAYFEMCRDLTDAWKPDHQRAAVSRQVTDAQLPAGVSAAEFEHARMVQDLCTAWKGDTDYAETPLKVKEGAQAPQGIWPLGGTPVGLTSAKANDICSTDGGRGRLVNRGGVLFCELASMTAPRVPPTNRSTDAMSAADGQRPWQEMKNDLENAWRS